MTSVTVPLTVATDRGEVDVVVRSSTPRPWRDVRGRVLLAAGLDEMQPLHLGAGLVEDDWLVGRAPLLAGARLTSHPADSLPSQPAMLMTVIAGPDAGKHCTLATSPITIGRDPASTLPLTDPRLSYHHAVATPTATGVDVTDLDSTNGVFVDGHPADDTPVATGSLIRLGGSLLQIQLPSHERTVFTPDGSGYLARQPVPSPDLPPNATVPEAPGEPPQRRKRAIPVVAALLGASVGITMAVMFGSALYLAFAALGPVSMMGTALADRFAGRRSHRAAMREYVAAARRYDDALARAIATQRRRCWRMWPDPATLVRRTEQAGPSLWNQRRGSECYLTVSVGSGDRQLTADTSTQDHVISNVPLTTTIDGRVDVVGPLSGALLRWIIVQLVCSHSPDDLALIVVGPSPDLAPCRFLPHIPGGPGAVTSTRTADGGEAVTVLGDTRATGDRDVVVIAVGDAAKSELVTHLTAQFTASEPRRLGVSLSHDLSITLRDSVVAGEPTRVPRQHFPPPAAAQTPTMSIITAAAPEGSELCAGQAERGDMTGVSADLLAQVCRSLAPLRTARGIEGSSNEGPVGLSNLVGTINADTLAARWRQPRPTAQVGMGEDGPVSINLDLDGPHLLIAGTTGSGKSELLRTVMASLAFACSPTELTFLLVDYKGGSAFQALTALPHVVGMLTDLDPTLSARALASLRAELRHREHLQATAGTSPPRLVVVIDEFATLATELPEFLTGLLDIAQRGRSLGIHLVLATQRPAGVVSPSMRANISTRICLRVTDPADSIDVIGSSAAADISPDTPGRALVATGRSTRAVQTALVSAPLPPDLAVHRLGQVPHLPPQDSRVTALGMLLTAAAAATRDAPPPRRPWCEPLPADISPADCDHETFALCDLPDSQSQQWLAAPATSVLVTGPTGSGRSTALRRVARIAAEAGDEIVVIDGADALADMARWPEVSTYLSMTNPRLAQRLLRLLADPDSRPGDGRGRCLVIDHYDSVTAALDRLDYAAGSALISDLHTRGAGQLRLMVSGPASMQHQRTAAAFPHRLDLDGHLTPGRGRWAGDSVQVVREAAGAAVSGQGGDAPRWSDPLIVRPLPVRVSAEQMPSSSCDAIGLGIGGDAARLMTVDLTGAGGAFVVAGSRQSGVTTALRGLVTRAAASGVPVIEVRSRPGRSDGATAGNRVTSICVASSTEPLRQALARHDGPLLLVADHGSYGDDYPAADLLEQFCHVHDERQYLLVGGRLDVFGRARRGHVRTALAYQHGILLNPDAADGNLFDVSVARRVSPNPPGRGLMVIHGQLSPIQLAEAGPDSTS